jgi:hypothetical protein
MLLLRQHRPHVSSLSLLQRLLLLRMQQLLLLLLLVLVVEPLSFSTGCGSKSCSWFCGVVRAQHWQQLVAQQRCPQPPLIVHQLGA